MPLLSKMIHKGEEGRECGGGEGAFLRLVRAAGVGSLLTGYKNIYMIMT